MKDPGERKHSPLPWHTGANNPDRVFDAKGAPVAHCDPRHKGFPIYENNARLIVEATTVYGARAALLERLCQQVREASLSTGHADTPEELMAEVLNQVIARTSRLAILLARCLPVIAKQVCHPNALAAEIRKAFGEGTVDDDAHATYQFALSADEVAGALQNLLSGIRSDLVTVDAIADETWANALQRCDGALANYHGNQK